MQKNNKGNTSLQQLTIITCESILPVCVADMQPPQLVAFRTLEDEIMSITKDGCLQHVRIVLPVGHPMANILPHTMSRLHSTGRIKLCQVEYPEKELVMLSIETLPCTHETLLFHAQIYFV